MQPIPNNIIDGFLSSLETEIDREGMAECCRCVIAFLVEGGFIKASKIRAHMVNVLYSKAKINAKSKTEALNIVAASMDIDEKQVRNILGNTGKY